MLGLPAEVESGSELKFSFFYCMFSLWSSGLLILVCLLSEGLAAFGSVLHSAKFLLLAALYELCKVGLAKLLSGHKESLKLPFGPGRDPRPVRGPLLRKLWVRLGRLLARLTPLYHFAVGLGLLLAVWLGLAALTVCFGAPLLSNWWETGTFCWLLVLLTAYPALLVLGPSPSSLLAVYTGSGLETTPPATATLSSLWLSTALGAWAAAAVIPLDWDRAWQAWPVPCCLGAVAGHLVGSTTSAARVWPGMAAAAASSSAARRKFV